MSEASVKRVKTSIHAAVWGPDWSPAGIVPALMSAARIGYDHVVVPLRQFDDIRPAELSREFSRYGLLPLNTCGLSPDKDIGAADASLRNKGIAHLKHAITLARDMGSTQIGGVLYGPLGKADKRVDTDAFKRAAEAMSCVAESAKLAGVRLAVEVVNRYETSVLYNTARGLEFLELVGEENVLLHLDTFHMSIEEVDPFQAMSSALSKLAYFELDQSHRGAPHEGSLDLPHWVGKLASLGYDGIVGVEAFSRSKLSADHANGLAIWEDRFHDGDKVAEQFMRIIKNGFAS